VNPRKELSATVEKGENLKLISSQSINYGREESLSHEDS
jgi:hypothetical protein